MRRSLRTSSTGWGYVTSSSSSKARLTCSQSLDLTEAPSMLEPLMNDSPAPTGRGISAPLLHFVSDSSEVRLVPKDWLV